MMSAAGSRTPRIAGLFVGIFGVLFLAAGAASARTEGVAQDSSPATAASVAVVVSQTALSVTEEQSKTYGVSLSADPGAAGATVVMSIVSRYANEKIALDPTSVSFSGGADGDWWLPKFVRVTALNDENRRNEMLQIAHQLRIDGRPDVVGPQLTVEVVDLKWLNQQGLEPPGEFDVEDGLIDEDLEEVEEIEHVYDIHSLIEQDGSYLWQDGDRQIVMRLLDSLSEGEQAKLDRLAENAARAYAPPLDGNDTRSTQQPLTTSHWFESDTGQRYLLAGGVNVVFASHVNEETAAAILARHGIPAPRVSPWGELSNAYHIATSSDAETMRLVAELSPVAGIDSVVPNWSTPFEISPTSLATGTGTDAGSFGCAGYTKVLGISDELAGCMWYFDSSTDYRSDLQTPPVDPTIDINIGDVWSTTKGEGVVVAIVDKPLDATHPDLVDNLDPSRFSNWGDPNPHPLSYRHGTAVAGVVGARDNTIGGRGVAPRATMINFNLLNNWSERYLVEAMSLHRDVVAVSNHSYSAGYGHQLSRTSDHWKRAVAEGITVGYGGRGQTYVVSAGNHRSWTSEGWTTHNEAKNHRGVINVCGVTAYGEATSYSEAGPSLWVCAPTLDVEPDLPGVLTTLPNNSYTDSFSGTSAAAPQVAGVAALMRSANPALTWRDVKVIIANTAQQNHPDSNSWLDGALKFGSQSQRYNYSYRYGFGVVDAEAAVAAARTWTLLPPMVTTESAEATHNAELSGTGGHEDVYSLTIPSEIDFIEHIDVIVNMNTGLVREYNMYLVSPSGTESLLSEASPYCSLNCPLRGKFQFGTARHLGESAQGTWQLKIRSIRGHDETCATISSSMCPTSRGQFNSWKIIIYGHESVASQTRRISLAASESHTTEGGDVTLTASIDGGALSTDLTVPIVVTPVTASASDYVAPSSIVIPAGETSASAVLSTLDDVLSEIDESVVIEIGALTPGHVAVGGRVVTTIIDDEPDPTVRIVVSDTNVTEGDAATVTAKLSSAVPIETRIALSLERLPPAARSDAKLKMPSGGARILTIPAGSVHSTQTATFTTTQNDQREYATGPRPAFRILGDVYGSQLADPAPVQVTILDDDGTLQACESLPDAVTAAQVVTWRDEATDADQVLRFNRVLAALGVRDDLAPMTIAESHLFEDLYTYDRWSAVTRTLNSFAQCSTGHLMTPPTVSVTAGPDVIEGDVFHFTVSAAPALTSPVTVEVTIATTGEFLVWSEPQQVTIPTSGAFDLKLSSGNDLDDEPDGTVTATVSAGAGYAVGDTDSATLTIQDDDELLSQIEIRGAATVSEGEGVSVTMIASPPPLSPLDVVVEMSQFSQDTATSWAQTVTMPTSGSVTFTVATPENNLDEPDSLLLVEVAYSLEYLLSYHGRVLVINVQDDDDPPTLALSASDSEAREGRSFEVTAELQGSVLTEAIEVALELVPQTATGPNDDGSAPDYRWRSGTVLRTGSNTTAIVRIEPGETSASATIEILEDEAEEADETFTVQMVTPLPTGIAGADGSPLTVKIVDSSTVELRGDPPPAGGLFKVTNPSGEEVVHVTLTPVGKSDPDRPCAPSSAPPRQYSLSPGQSAGSGYVETSCSWRHDIEPAREECAISIEIRRNGRRVTVLPETWLISYGNPYISILVPSYTYFDEARIVTTCDS